MSNNYPTLSSNRLLKNISFAIIILLLIARIGYSQLQTLELKQGVLQGSIHIQPKQPISSGQPDRIQPGTQVKIEVTIENKGPQESPSGQLYVRYAFAHPLDKEESSVLFETEKKPLPPIKPGQKVNIAFDTLHQIPSLLDFVRYDWSIREYQAIAMINHKDYMIGTLAITFSAYYYPAIKKEFPLSVTP